MRTLSGRASRVAAFGALFALAATSSSASAESPLVPPPRADRVPSPGRGAAADDTADAISLNPSALALLRSYDIRWTGVFCPSGVQSLGCGQSVEAATPLPFGISTGLRIDWMRPLSSAPFPYAGFDYTWLTWAVAWHPSRLFSVGASIQHSYSPNAYINGITGLTASASLRPFKYLALAAIARDFNNPAPDVLPMSQSSVLDANFVFAAAVRPTGTRAFELGLEGRYLLGTHDWIPRATAVLEVPKVGRLRGGIETSRLDGSGPPKFTASVGLEVNYGPVSGGGGVLFGAGEAVGGAASGYGTLAYSGFENGGIPSPSHAVSIRIESTPDVKGHFALLKKLWALSEAGSVEAVALQMRAEPAGSMALAEELADAVRLLRARGKKVLCSLEDAQARSLYVCANADRTVMNPAGGLRYSGLRSQHMYLAGLLSKLGIKAEFVRIGDHKTAPEQFMNEHGSETAHADYADFLHQVESIFVRNLSQGRKLSEESIREKTAKGPFVATEAREAGFIDSFAFDDELEHVIGEMVGHSLSLKPYEHVDHVAKSFAPQPRIALLHVDGDITDGRSSVVPIVGMKLVGSYSIVDEVKALRADPMVRAVVLRIDSPGGSSMASDVMWRELSLLAKEKPLIVSMGAVAASGGYYIAAASKNIFALPLTVTGSIGIFYGKADVSALLGKIGVNIETIRTAPRADAESLYRPFTDDERKELEHKVHQFYDVFLDRVASGRGMTKEAVDAVGQGHVWTGQQAYERHLVDHLGGLRDAIAAAREAAHLPSDCPIVELPLDEPTLFEKALKVVGFGAAPSGSTFDALPPAVKSLARTVAPMVVYTSDIPLARLDGWAGGDEGAE